MPGQCPTPRLARGIQAVAGSDYKPVVEIRFNGCMNTMSERRPGQGNHLPSASMPALIPALQAFCLGRFPFPA
jgi:hypothetical protein